MSTRLVPLVRNTATIAEVLLNALTTAYTLPSRQRKAGVRDYLQQQFAHDSSEDVQNPEAVISVALTVLKEDWGVGRRFQREATLSRLVGGLEGYTRANCHHSGESIMDGQYLVCLRCGHERMT